MESSDAMVPAAWWLTEGGRDPIGPVTTELVIEWIRAGFVIAGALVCEVGGDAWRSLGDVSPFSRVLAGRSRRFDRTKELCLGDPEELDSPQSDSEDEVTAVAVPRPSHPPLSGVRVYFDPDRNE